MPPELQEDREVVLGRVDLPALLGSIGNDRGLGVKGKAYPCPSAAHEQTGDTPPATLSVSGGGYGVWKCHSCDAGGSALDALVAAGRAADIADAFRQLKDPAPLLARKPAPTPAPLPPKVAARILEVKGWSATTLARLGVGWDGRRLTIPVRDAVGRPAGTVRYRPLAADGDRKMLADPGTARLPFPPPETLEGPEVWIVEGEPDGITGQELGLSATAIPGVDSWKPGWAVRFKRFERAVIVPDCDDTGRALARRVATDLIDVGVEVRVLDLDPARSDKYDLGDALVENLAERDEFVRLLHAAADAVKPVSAKQAALERAAARAESVGLPLVVRDGADVIAATETYVPGVWGAHPQVLWAKGEPFMIAGATGSGKTTLAQQLILRRAGAIEDRLLDLVVEESPRPVMYLAIDRDRQARRSMRRMVATVPRGRLLWHSDLGAYKPTSGPPAQFVEWLGVLDVGTLVVDSLYGLLSSVKDDRVLDWYGHLMRELADAEIEVLVLHHLRKAGKDDVGGSKIDQIYGGGQVTWAAGSILAMSGEPGATEVDAYHVKQPAKLCGPWTLTHDHEHGVTSAAKHPSPLEYLRAAGQGVLDDVVEGCRLEGKAKATKRQLDDYVTQELLILDGKVYRPVVDEYAKF